MATKRKGSRRGVEGKPTLRSDGKPFTPRTSPNAPKFETNGSTVRNGITLPVMKNSRRKPTKKK